MYFRARVLVYLCESRWRLLFAVVENTSKMPCLTSERYRIDSVEKLRKNMCSTPLHSVTAGLPENDVDFLEFFNISGVSRLDETEDHDKDAAAPAPIDESYYKILWELERINKIKREREHCLQRSITLLRDNDSKLQCCCV